ncbi:MAG TPA: phage/plasmid primase, P4 family [Bryobacteraceae bacterium]|nr:phage/plasmid primase, P4 family [Bryobacteraceae bacterium]
MEADRHAIRQFLERVHGPEPTGWLILWTRQDKATRAFNLGEEGALDQAVEYCAARASTFDVYAAVGLQHERPANSSRGAEAGVSVLPGLWADVDIAGAAHKAEALPPTEQDARSLIDTAVLEPSLVVHSGFGLQPYWLFREPYQIESEDERKQLKSLSTRFQLNLRLRANVRGWTMDSTADLCRVLRVPGTFNHKVDGDIRMVTAEYADHAYNLADFEDLLGGIEDPGDGERVTQPPLDLPAAKLPPILDGCVWMRHCRTDAAALAEPEWYRMLTVVARCEDAERWAHELSQAYPKYSRRETQRKLKQASSDKVAPVTCAYVQSNLNGGRFCAECLFRGNVNSPIAIGRIEGFEAAPAPEPPPASGDDPPPPEQPQPTEAAATKIEKYTDLGNARRFVARYRGTVLYCEAWGRWFHWDTARWAEDERLEVFARATDLIRSLYAVAKKIKDEDERKAFLSHLIKSESHRSIHAMVTLAKSDRTVARHPDDFDNNQWLCAVKNGTLDLRTGQLRSHDPKDMITKLAPVVYDPSARCPNWLEFLNMIMLGRKSLVDFLKRALGSSLTGITSDKAMFILYGPGGDNGKSTMVEVMEMLLGNYARRTPVETFLKKREGSIPNDIARLRGARFVWAAENDRGVRLAESLIKEMTGGDRMAARFLHGEFFEFMPTFKIWFATNHKPTIRGDAAIWRRLKLVPFDYTIPKDQQKKRHEVMAMFQSELPGILNWAIEGCLEWQRDGLGVPEEVINATREYESEQDTFSMFLEEKCVRAPNARVLSLALYREYKTWAEEHGETPASHKTFASLMSERGFAKSKTMKGALYSGVGLRTEDHYDTPKAAQTTPRQTRFDRDDDGEEV